MLITVTLFSWLLLALTSLNLVCSAIVRVCWLHKMKVRPCCTGWSRLLLVERVQAAEEVLKRSGRPGLRCWGWLYCYMRRRNRDKAVLGRRFLCAWWCMGVTLRWQRISGVLLTWTIALAHIAMWGVLGSGRVV